MKARHVFEYLVLAFVCCTGAQPADDQSHYGLVRFFVMDSYGGSLRQFHIKILGLVSGKQATWDLNGSTPPIRLPYGTYLIRATASLCDRLERSIIVDKAETLAIIGLTRLRGDQISGDAPVLNQSLKGKVIASSKPSDQLWVRIYPLFGIFFAEASVNSSGNFEIPGVPNGSYILAVFQRDRIVTQRTIAPNDITGQDRDLMIRLSGDLTQ